MKHTAMVRAHLDTHALCSARNSGCAGSPKRVPPWERAPLDAHVRLGMGCAHLAGMRFLVCASRRPGACSSAHALRCAPELRAHAGNARTLLGMRYTHLEGARSSVGSLSPRRIPFGAPLWVHSLVRSPGRRHLEFQLIIQFL